MVDPVAAEGMVGEVGVLAPVGDVGLAVGGVLLVRSGEGLQRLGVAQDGPDLVDGQLAQVRGSGERSPEVDWTWVMTRLPAAVCTVTGKGFPAAAGTTAAWKSHSLTTPPPAHPGVPGAGVAEYADARGRGDVAVDGLRGQIIHHLAC